MGGLVPLTPTLFKGQQCHLVIFTFYSLNIHGLNSSCSHFYFFVCHFSPAIPCPWLPILNHVICWDNFLSWRLRMVPVPRY